MFDCDLFSRIVQSRRDGSLTLPRWWRTGRLEHFLTSTHQHSLLRCKQPTRERQAYPDHLSADFGDGLILREGNVGQQWGVADNVGECVAVDVGLELPARRVGVPGADVFGLEALEFLLRAEFVGLYAKSVRAPGPNYGGYVPY